MGFGGISLWQLMIILVIVMLIFGTKRLRSIGGDLGSAVKGFRKAVSDGEDEPPAKLVEHEENESGQPVEEPRKAESTK